MVHINWGLHPIPVKWLGSWLETGALEVAVNGFVIDPSSCGLAIVSCFGSILYFFAINTQEIIVQNVPFS